MGQKIRPLVPKVNARYINFEYGGEISGKVASQEKIFEILELSKKIEKSIQEKQIAREKVVSEEKIEVAEEKPEEIDNDELNDTENVIDFEEVLIQIRSIDEAMELKIPNNTLFKDAIEYCISKGKFDIRNTVQYLQKENPRGECNRLTQNAVKQIINNQFAEWCEEQELEMKEKSVSYFLKSFV